MSDAPEKPDRIVIVEPDSARRDALEAVLRGSGYDVQVFEAARAGLDAARQAAPELFLMSTLAGAAPPADSEAYSAIHAHDVVAAIRGSAATQQVRVILLVGSSAEERAAALDLGADDAVSEPFDPTELLARVRVQLRAHRADSQLLERTRLAEEGQQIAQTAFQALAVTEKMTSDAFSLDRRLKIGVGTAFAIALVMAGIYFLFARSAGKSVQVTNATIVRLEHGIMHQQEMLAEVRRLRDAQQTAGGEEGKDALQKHAAELRAQMANSEDGKAGELQKELDETNARLKKLEKEGDSADAFIAADVRSVCLLHVSVGFRNQQTNQRLRYAGLNPQGEPIQDSDGNPILTLEGNGPEVKLDVFGTGFVAGGEGRIITNRHVAEPWWKNDDLSDLTSQGFQPEISSIRAYFPGDPRAFHAEIEQISKETDLAAMRVDMLDLKRPALSIDPAKTATTAGDPVVLMGYATGLAAILARTDENTAQQILTQNDGDVSQVLDALAGRDLIHPLITQGHIGDILPDKIVFDAQTTSGGSGGPLFNPEGRVIGVTYAILKGFAGSNFGIPIRFSEPLLSPAGAQPSPSN